MNDAPRLKLVEVERYERDVRLRLPFRFGVTTVTHATQAVIRATIALPDGRTEQGVAAETLAAKWFDKNLALSDAQNLDQLRQSVLAEAAPGIEQEGAARLQHPPDFTIGADPVGEEHHAILADDQVELSVIEGQLLGIRGLEPGPAAWHAAGGDR